MNENQNPWSKEYIDSHSLPKVSKDLLPWLLKDRKEAVEGVYTIDEKGKPSHDGSGLDKAERSLKQAKSVLAGAPTDTKILAFALEQLAMAQSKVAFYSGKIYLLDKIIAATQAAQ